MRHRPHAVAAVTIVEVMASALLIFIGLGAVFNLNTRSLQILRQSRQYATASQILQERIEMMRAQPWPQISRAQSLATLMQTPASSSRDLADAEPFEELFVTLPQTPGDPTPTAKVPVLTVRRAHNEVQVVSDGDLSAAPVLLVEADVSWVVGGQTRRRSIRTVIARNGLTRAGIFGSIVGRPAMDTAQH